MLSKVIGVGDVFLQTNMRMQLLIRGVKHALNARFNLIFVHMLNGGGMIITLVLESENSPQVTWLWLEEKNKINCVTPQFLDVMESYKRNTFSRNDYR